MPEAHAAAAAGAQQPGAVRTLVVTTAIQAMTSMAIITVPAMAPVVADALGVSAALVGPYVALCYLAASIASLLGGPLVRRAGAIRASQIGLLLCVAGLALCATGWLPALALGALLMGIGYGPINPASSHLLAVTTPAHRMSLMFSLKQTGVPLGGMLAGALVPGLALAWGWRASLALVALACLTCIALAQPLRAALDADRRPDQPIVLGALLDPLRMVLGHRPLLVLAICSFLFSAVQVSTTSYLVTFLHSAVGITLLAAGAALSVSQVAGAVARVAWGALADRGLGPRGTLILLSTLMTVSCLLAASIQPGWSVALQWLAVGLLGATVIGWNGVFMATVAKQAPPGQASVATGGALMFTFFGVVCGAPAFGALAGASGSYRVAFAALAVPAAAALSLLVWRALQARRETAAAAAVNAIE